MADGIGCGELERNTVNLCFALRWSLTVSIQGSHCEVKGSRWVTGLDIVPPFSWTIKNMPVPNGKADLTSR